MQSKDFVYQLNYNEKFKIFIKKDIEWILCDS